MITVAIVEDDAEERGRIRECLAYAEEKEGVSFSVTEYPSGTAFIGGYKPGCDIVFMDIQMPGMDGMETARALRRMDRTVIIIFVTNMAQYAVEGYEVEALDFILKPINKYAFAMRLKRAIARTTRRDGDGISLRCEGETYKIRVSDIRYLEVDGHYIVYHTEKGEFREYTTMKEAESRVRRPFFVKCSQSFMVNLRYVSSVKKDTVYLDGAELPISRPQKKAFMEAFSAYLGGGAGNA